MSDNIGYFLCLPLGRKDPPVYVEAKSTGGQEMISLRVFDTQLPTIINP